MFYLPCAKKCLIYFLFLYFGIIVFGNTKLNWIWKIKGINSKKKFCRSFNTCSYSVNCSRSFGRIICKQTKIKCKWNKKKILDCLCNQGNIKELLFIFTWCNEVSDRQTDCFLTVVVPLKFSWEEFFSRIWIAIQCISNVMDVRWTSKQRCVLTGEQHQLYGNKKNHRPCFPYPFQRSKYFLCKHIIMKNFCSKKFFLFFNTNLQDISTAREKTFFFPFKQ